MIIEEENSTFSFDREIYFYELGDGKGFANGTGFGYGCGSPGSSGDRGGCGYDNNHLYEHGAELEV